MINQLVNIVFPIFLVVGAGYLYGRFRYTDMTEVNRLNFEVFTPLLVISVFSNQSFELSSFGFFAIGGALLVLIPGVLLWPLRSLVPINGRAWLLTAMFRNTGNMGLPLAFFTYGEKIMPAAVILFVVSNVLHFSVGIAMVKGRVSLAEAFRHPTIVATVIGVSIAGFQIVLPQPLQSGLDLLGAVAIPLLLFSLGVRMIGVDFGDWRLGLASALLFPVAGVITAWGLVHLLNISGDLADLLILFGALPPAVLNFLMAERYGLEPKKVASIVLIGNGTSFLIIPLVLTWILG